jgi:hypothetical protein
MIGIHLYKQEQAPMNTLFFKTLLAALSLMAVATTATASFARTPPARAVAASTDTCRHLLDRVGPPQLHGASYDCLQVPTGNGVAWRLYVMTEQS